MNQKRSVSSPRCSPRSATVFPVDESSATTMKMPARVDEVDEPKMEMEEDDGSDSDSDDSEDEYNPVCPICLEEFEEGDMLRVLPCPGKHKFHCDCVDDWLEVNCTCPTCRVQVCEAGETAAPGTLGRRSRQRIVGMTDPEAAEPAAVETVPPLAPGDAPGLTDAAQTTSNNAEGGSNNAEGGDAAIHSA